MYINNEPVTTSRGSVTDVCATRMDELYGCWQEARRCDKISGRLRALQVELDEHYEHISALTTQVDKCSRILRDLFDLFPIYRSRVPLVLYYLQIILPTMCKTMRDMTIYIENDELPIHIQWRLMDERLSSQGGTTLAQRFLMYCEALVQTVRLLSRCSKPHPRLPRSHWFH